MFVIYSVQGNMEFTFNCINVSCMCFGGDDMGGWVGSEAYAIFIV